MYKLDLETLNEDRLRKAVDPQTYRLGQELFARTQIQTIEVTDFTAALIVPDKRKYRVEFKVAREHVFLKCGCSHASRGLVCEHEVAAWLSLRQHFVRQTPSLWQMQLSQALDSAWIAQPRSRSNPYYLFFSLSEEEYEYSSQWAIAPYTLPLSALPTEMRKGAAEADEAEVHALLEAEADALRRLKSPYHSLEPQACLNCPPEVVNLANIILERNRAYLYSYNVRFPLENYLSLLRNTRSPLYLGKPSNPLFKPLTILQEIAELRLFIDHCETGIRLHPQLVASEQPLQINLDKAREILSDPLWLLAGDYLLEISNLSAAALLNVFQDQTEVVIPADQTDAFAEKYLLDLAQRFSIHGDAIAWETVIGEPAPRVYLNDNNGELQAQLRFGYGEVEVHYDPNMPTETIQRKREGLGLLRVMRQPEAERQAFEALSSATFGLKRAAQPGQPGLFRLRARVHPVDFLLNSVPRLARAGFEVYGEELLKTARVNRNTPTISFKVASGIDWFDVHAVVNFGELEVSLQDIRRALRKHERHIKLTDGSIGEIPEEWIERYKHLFSLGEAEGEALRFSRHHIAIIEDALTQADYAQADEEFERRRKRLRALLQQDFEGIQPHPLPEGFIGELRPYQKAGFDWLHFLREMEFGGCLADDMGLGKTVQTLAFLLSLYSQPEAQRPKQASLLVVPRSLLVNWQREASRFTPGLRILEFFDIDRVKDTTAFDQADLIITTYGVLLRDIQFLHGYTFYYAILDESQSIKNPLSQTARAAHLLRAQHRLVLTGTPIENSTAELWSQFAFLNPGMLGNLQYFKTEFGLPIEKRNDDKAASKLRKLVYPFILRRTKDQVAPELPPRTERILYCDMEPGQRKLYNRTRDYYRGVVLGLLEKEGLNNSRMKILEGLLRLRQICNHPLLVDEKFHGDSAKFELLMDTLETLRAENHKTLVFSQFVKMLSLVRKEMEARLIPYTYLDGQVVARQEQVDLFQNDPSIPFFLISLRAGGLGLNLTAADYVIHIDPWWNPAVEMQASDRTHRIGQDKPVFVYKLIARDSVEEKILVLQERKRNLVDQIVAPETAFFKSLTLQDIEELFSN
ncbi:MAG: SNF2-related protein [Anaerolineales bacterium]|nr:SNF2-related protein [Anaerolineales bacterium]